MTQLVKGDGNGTQRRELYNGDGVVRYRRVQGLEEDLEKSEEKLIIANQKLDKVNTT
jgi:hypothetical protein